MSIPELNFTTETNMASSTIIVTGIQPPGSLCQAIHANDFNILVVDDEDSARRSAIFLLEGLGFYNHRDASNGNAALEIICSGWADIVLTDIRMPALSGIELLQRCSVMKKAPAFVFISGYDLFEYAQKAIHLGAQGYLLKPFDEDELNEVLSNICTKILEVRRVREKDDQGGINNLEEQRRSFLLSMFNGKNQTVEDKLSLLNIPQSAEKCCVMSVVFEQDRSTNSRQESQKFKGQQEAILSAGLFCLEPLCLAIYPFHTESMTSFLLCFGNLLDAEIGANLLTACEELRSRLQCDTEQAIVIEYGQILSIQNGLAACFESCARQIIHRMIQGDATNSDTANPKSFTCRCDFEDSLCEHLGKFAIDNAIADIESLYNNFLFKGYSNFIGLSYLHEETLKILRGVLYQLGAETTPLQRDNDDDLNDLCQAETFEKIFSWYHKKISNAFSCEDMQELNSMRGNVLRAKQYMYRNLSSPLSLELVSSHVNLSPNYFSRCFKEETGENFGNYLLDLRIESAKGLLKQGKYKAAKVGAMVGFSDIKYFYKVFKKVTGLSPGKFR